MNKNENGGEKMLIGVACIVNWNSNLNILTREKRGKNKLKGEKKKRRTNLFPKNGTLRSKIK